MNELTTKLLADRLGKSPVSVRQKLRTYEAVTGRPLPRSIEGAWCVSATVADHLERASYELAIADIGTVISFEAALRMVLGISISVGTKSEASQVDEKRLAELALLRGQVRRLQRQLLESQHRQDLLDRQYLHLIRVCRKTLEGR